MLGSIFSFLLNFDPAVSVLIFGTFVLFIINIFYKILIKQDDARQIKQRSKELSKEMQEAQKAKDTERSKKLLDELLAENNKLMKLTMKPMIVSFVVVIIFLPVLSELYGDRSAQLVSDVGIVKLNGVNHTVRLVNGTPVLEDAVPYLALSSIQPGCDSECFVAQEGGRYEVRYENELITVAPIVTAFPVELPFAGNTVGWLGWYIITSLPIAFLMRKLMKIYI